MERTVCLAKKLKKSKAKSKPNSKAKKADHAPKKKKKAAAPAGKLVEIEARLPITDHDARLRGKVAYEKMQERDKLILERKTVASGYKATIDALTSEATKLLKECNEGTELRAVKAREVKDFDQEEVRYLYQGEVIHVRPMTLADKQQDLPLKESKDAPLPKVSAVEKHPSESQPAKAEDLEEEDEGSGDARADVADVIKQETRANSKWSAVDGPRV
jgi:hypothetical protein